MGQTQTELSSGSSDLISGGFKHHFHLHQRVFYLPIFLLALQQTWESCAIQAFQSAMLSNSEADPSVTSGLAPMPGQYRVMNLFLSSSAHVCSSMSSGQKENEPGKRVVESD